MYILICSFFNSDIATITCLGRNFHHLHFAIRHRSEISTGIVLLRKIGLVCRYTPVNRQLKSKSAQLKLSIMN